MWLGQVLRRMLLGQGRSEDLALLDSIARNMTGTCFCPLGESVPPAIYSSLRFFRTEFEQYAKGAGGVPQAVHA
jgi:NADH-quinone oxidoreductase subunit F